MSESAAGSCGIPVFAADEPAQITGANSTIILVWRIKQALAENFRLQINEQTCQGLTEQSLDGWNIGTPRYSYTATIWAEITDATLRALPGILNPGQDGYDDTSEHASDQPEVDGGLFEPAICGR